MHLDVLERVEVGLADLRHDADRNPLRVERGQLSLLEAGGHDEVALLDPLALGDAVQEEDVLRALAVADDADRARRAVLRGDRALLVGEEGDLGLVAGHLRHLADEAAVGDDGVVDADAVGAARGDDHGLVELAGRVRDDARRDGVREVLWIVGPALVLEDFRRLLSSSGAFAFWIACCCALLSSLCRRSFSDARVEKVGRPVVGVLERARNAVGGDLEGAQHARAGALEAVQAAVRGLRGSKR